jgi:hypothetical protein
MLSFAASLRPDSEAFAIFVTEKYEYKNTEITKNVAQKIDSFIKIQKVRNKEEEISSFDISDKQKCFVIKVKNKYESYWPQENGGSFYSYLKKFKNIKKIDLYADSLLQDKEKLSDFFSQFIFGVN